MCPLSQAEVRENGDVIFESNPLEGRSVLFEKTERDSEPKRQHGVLGACISGNQESGEGGMWFDCHAALARPETDRACEYLFLFHDGHLEDPAIECYSVGEVSTLPNPNPEAQSKP